MLLRMLRCGARKKYLAKMIDSSGVLRIRLFDLRTCCVRDLELSGFQWLHLKWPGWVEPPNEVKHVLHRVTQRKELDEIFRMV